MLNLVRIVEQQVPPDPQAVAAALHREREIEMALMEEFGPSPGIPVKPVKDVDLPGLSELLRTVAEAKLAGKTVWPCDDPFARRVGFIVDEDDACYRIPLTALKAADIAVWKEHADAAGMDVPEFKKAFSQPSMRSRLFGNGDVPFNEFTDEDPDLDEKAATLAAMAEAENEALAMAEQEAEDIGIPRPEGTRYVYDYSTGPNTKVTSDLVFIKKVTVKVFVEYAPADPAVSESVLAATASNRALGESTFFLDPKTFEISQSREISKVRPTPGDGPVDLDVGPTEFAVKGSLLPK